MKFYYSDLQDQHDAKKIHVNAMSRTSRDRPERGYNLLKAVRNLGLEECAVRPQGTEILAGVHSPRYVQFLKTLWQRWQDEVVPEMGEPDSGVIANVWPNQRVRATYPRSVIGQVGFHMHDQVAPVREKTFEIALRSASTAWCAADEVLNGASECYALCRPSGHHTGWENCGGSSYLNNAGVAAQHLLSKFKRVLLVDIDVHHGNGTQDIFYFRNDVFFISLHRDTIDYHPFFWGHDHERGEGSGLGCNLNVPIKAHSGDDVFAAALDGALNTAADFNAEALVISAGYDAYEHDPSNGLKVTLNGFANAGKRFARLGLPTVIVQEGGYAVDEQGQCLKAFLNGFISERN